MALKYLVHRAWVLTIDSSHHFTRVLSQSLNTSTVKVMCTSRSRSRSSLLISLAHGETHSLGELG
jgi:hypothetical protein